MRHNLRNRCQQVPQVSSNSQVWRAIADWETLYADYLDAGGKHMEYEDRRDQILRILPKDLRRDLFRRLNEFKTVPGIKDWLREQLELERDWAETDLRSKSRAIGMLDNNDDDGAGEADMEALLALDENSSMDDVLAVQQRFRRFASRPGGQRPPKGNGKGKGGGKGGGRAKDGTARLPGDPQASKCINCGQTGHATRNCPEGRRDPRQRPCFGCGKTGHMKANCPANKTAGAPPSGWSSRASGRLRLPRGRRRRQAMGSSQENGEFEKAYTHGSEAR